MGFESFKQEDKKEVPEKSLKLMEKMRNFCEKTPYSLKAALAIVALSAAMKQEVVASEDVEINPTLASVAQKFEAVSQQLQQAGDADWHAYMEFKHDPNSHSFKTDFPVFPGKGAGIFEMNSVSVVGMVDNQGEPQMFDGLTLSYSLDYDGAQEIRPVGEPIEVTMERDPALDINLHIVMEISNRLQELETEMESETNNALSLDDEVLEESYTQNIEQRVNMPLAEWEINSITDENGETTGYSIMLQPGEIISDE